MIAPNRLEREAYGHHPGPPQSQWGVILWTLSVVYRFDRPAIEKKLPSTLMISLRKLRPGGRRAIIATTAITFLVAFFIAVTI